LTIGHADALAESLKVFAVLDEIMPATLDGKEAILQMRAEGSPNWRQMEWIGFWFEHIVEQHVRPALGGRSGPTIGRVTFDLQIEKIWDLKVHPDEAGSRAILNDQEAMHLAVKDFRGIGFIMVSGSATYDSGDGSFKAWHDTLKGGQSAYEENRIKRGAPSRRRKIAFSPTGASAIWFPSEVALADGTREGWLKEFQRGMRNSNGVPRRPKYQIDLAKIPDQLVIAKTKFGSSL